MLWLLLLLLLLAVGGVCFKLGQLSGISIVDKERPFSYAAVLLLRCCCCCCCTLIVVVASCCCGTEWAVVFTN